MNIPFVSKRSRDAFEAWRAADGEARAVEAKLANAWQRYFAHEAPPPPENIFIEVSSARARANAKLTQAISRLSSEVRGEHPNSAR